MKTSPNTVQPECPHKGLGFEFIIYTTGTPNSKIKYRTRHNSAWTQEIEAGGWLQIKRTMCATL